jgi:hypothetical protein
MAGELALDAQHRLDLVKWSPAEQARVIRPE